LGNDTLILINESKTGGFLITGRRRAFKASSSEVDAGSREENASEQKSGASVLIQSEQKTL
jgi:hypothetical protein